MSKFKKLFIAIFALSIFSFNAFAGNEYFSVGGRVQGLTAGNSLLYKADANAEVLYPFAENCFVGIGLDANIFGLIPYEFNLINTVDAYGTLILNFIRFDIGAFISTPLYKPIGPEYGALGRIAYYWTSNSGWGLSIGAESHFAFSLFDNRHFIDYEEPEGTEDEEGEMNPADFVDIICGGASVLGFFIFAIPRIYIGVHFTF